MKRTAREFRIGATTLLSVLVFLFSGLGCSDEFRCTVDYDCPNTKVCNIDSGNCESLQCEIDDDCMTPGHVCYQNACIAPQELPADG